MRSRDASDTPLAPTTAWPTARRALPRTAPTRPAPTTPTPSRPGRRPPSAVLTRSPRSGTSSRRIQSSGPACARASRARSACVSRRRAASRASRCDTRGETGPGVECTVNDATSSRRCSGPCSRPSDCVRSCGTTTRVRKTRPPRSRSARSVTVKPLRRHEKRSSRRARRGDTTKCCPASRPDRPSSSRPRGSGVPRSGSTSHRAASASSRVPTGRSTLVLSVPSVLTPYPATLTSTRHQSGPRQNGPCRSRTAWTRPGGIVCERVSSRPWRRRMPSGEMADRKPNSP